MRQSNGGFTVREGVPHAACHLECVWMALQPQGCLLGCLPAPRCSWALPLGPWHNPSGSGPDCVLHSASWKG